VLNGPRVTPHPTAEPTYRDGN